jgi:hypothetical protein
MNIKFGHVSVQNSRSICTVLAQNNSLRWRTPLSLCDAKHECRTKTCSRGSRRNPTNKEQCHCDTRNVIAVSRQWREDGVVALLALFSAVRGFTIRRQANHSSMILHIIIQSHLSAWDPMWKSWYKAQQIVTMASKWWCWSRCDIVLQVIQYPR